MDKLNKEIEKELNNFIPKIKCQICSQEEIRKSSNHLFCHNCKNKARKERDGKYRNQDYLKNLYKKGNNLIGIVKCIECRKELFSYKIKRRRFCSYNCQYKYNSKNFNPHNKGRNVIFIKCATCGGKVRTYRWAKRRFCSRLCYENDKKQNWIFPHKGKPILEWMFKGDQLKLDKYRNNLKNRMIEYFKEHPEFLEKRRGKTLIELYGEEVAKRIKEQMKQSGIKTWKEKREYMLNTPNRFKKGQKPWNTGKKMPREMVEKGIRIRELNYLKKLGIKNGNH